MALEGKTLAEASGIKIGNSNNRWLSFIQKSHDDGSLDGRTKQYDTNNGTIVAYIALCLSGNIDFHRSISTDNTVGKHYEVHERKPQYRNKGRISELTKS
jgi:hypothetical protein